MIEPPEFAADTVLAIEAVEAAGRLVRRLVADPAGLEVRAKRPNDFVTQVDLASEALIVQRLLSARPDHAVRSEEHAALHGCPGAAHVWIVDPIDGTNNLIHGVPAYAVTLAQTERGALCTGVTLDVPRGELFVAERGKGAWLREGDGWRRLAVSARADLAAAVVATSAPLPGGAEFGPAWHLLGQVMRSASAVRRLGSAALDLAWVAAGRFDASFDRGLAPWDVAAGALLVREAGGVVSTYDGDQDVLAIRECLAAAAPLHAALRRILGDAS